MLEKLRNTVKGYIRRVNALFDYEYIKLVLLSPLVLLELDAGSVGLALSYSVTLMGMFQWGVRQSAEVENMVRGSLFLTTLICFFK